METTETNKKNERIPILNLIMEEINIKKFDYYLGKTEKGELSATYYYPDASFTYSFDKKSTGVKVHTEIKDFIIKKIFYK